MTMFSEPLFPTQPKDGSKLRRWDEELVAALSQMGLNIKHVLAGGVTLEDNVDCSLVSFTSNGVANTEDTVPHTLGRVPTHFIVASLDKAAVVYKGGTTFTATNIYLKTSLATTAVKLIVL